MAAERYWNVAIMTYPVGAFLRLPDRGEVHWLDQEYIEQEENEEEGAGEEDEQ